MNLTRPEEQLLSRLTEQAERAGRGQTAVFTRFLDPREQELAQLAAREAQVKLVPYGGGDPPFERRVVAFDGRDWTDDEPDWPVQAVELTWDSRFGAPAHRDILGAVLALGINRDSLGDITLEEGAGRALLWATDAMAAFLVGNLERAGRVAIKAKLCADGLAAMPQGKMEPFTVSVASLRLDAVVAAAYDLSREEAAKAIRAGLVKVDHRPEDRTDHQIIEGALLSLRGRGRVRLIDASGRTRRSGRIKLEMERTL